MPPRFRVRFLVEPPFTVQVGAVTWRVIFDRYGKGGKRAALPPGCDRWLSADELMIPLRVGYRPRSAAEVARLVREYGAGNGSQ